LDTLAPAPDALILDGTVGTGGHALALLRAGARVIGIDRDEAALAVAVERLRPFGPRFRPVCGNYADLPAILEKLEVSSVDGILLDLGVSTFQLDDASRGFSFRLDGPLDMRFSRAIRRTAADLIEALGERALEEILRRYGQERYARRIARALKRRVPPGGRPSSPVRDPTARTAPRKTRELGDLVADAVPRSGRRIHPATRVFQALRIAVNDELTHLSSFLDSFDRYLRPGARAVILSYHSLEDRPVKRAFAQKAHAGILKILTRKVVRPEASETAANPRARGAKLRAAERR
jgi:16S rRNA (cytosine1402-N4)-methyltransferase